MPSRPRRELPTFYYHAHFRELLAFVSSHYAHVLRAADREFITTFEGLSFNAQCLYVRLMNRKGRVFRTSKLVYPELAPLVPLIDELTSVAMAGAPVEADLPDLLQGMTRPELTKLLGRCHITALASATKAALVSLAQATDRGLVCAAVPQGRYLVQRRTDTCHYLLFLFFGSIREGMTRFTMRDLGLMRMHDFQDDYEPRFGERDEALEHYYFASRLTQLDEARADTLIAEADDWPATLFPGAARLRDRLARQLGRHLERSERQRDALGIYRRGESLACFEREVRLLFAVGDIDAARERLESCIDDPVSDEAALFARDIYERKFEKKRTSALTDTLREAQSLNIDDSRRNAPERAVIDHLQADGARAFHTENALWPTLMGLLFWDQLFEAGDAGLHSPFDWLPASLNDGTFYASRKALIESRLSMLSTAASAKRLMLHHMTQHHGTANGLFRWRRSVIEAAFALVAAGNASAAAVILRRLCQDYRRSRIGYPDLLVIDGADARFIEVKSDGDQVRRNQLLRLRQLREAGFRADALRVRWVLDPAQTYVVVDVETTGGRSDAHRVTEVGAVKLRAGRIVDRFQSLVNPERRIPPNITRLTGISEAMVADAPRFADIADELAGFLGDAIFVAHNVEFDYGFISREYRRLGRTLRMPKLCTCASMRRLYPGHRSYSLAALCGEYGIELETHHRALCDAEAAAQLLLLINDKRADDMSPSKTTAGASRHCNTDSAGALSVVRSSTGS